MITPVADLADLFRRARGTREHLRAKHLAKADYRLVAALVKVRKERGLSQQDVADRLGLTQQAVAKIERYDNDPKLSTLRRYAHAVGALVAHVVEVDEGQLERGEWLAVSYSMPTITPVASNTYAVEGIKRTDFVIAA